jgi:hypothetical protein
MTSDGKAVILKLDVDEDFSPLSLPIEAIPGLIDVTCCELTKAMKMQGQNTSFVAPAEWFEFGKGPNGENVLSMTFGSGGKFSYHLPLGMLENMYEVLGQITGRSVPLRQDGPSN